MKTIPTVDSTSLIVDEILYQQAQDNADAHLRMEEGADKYGASWAVVDLKTDLMEELLDALNYPLLMAVRVHHATGGLTLEDWETISLFRDKVKELVAFADSFFPNFDGPTSAEYVEATNGRSV